MEQVPAASGPVAAAPAVLLELSLDRTEEILAHEAGDFDEDSIFRRCVNPRDRPPGLLGAAALRAEALRLELSRARLAERRRPLVGRILEDQPDHRAIPGRLAGPRGDTVAAQASAHLTDGAPFLADPLKDLPHNPGLFGQDLIACLAATLVFADVSVAVGRTAEYVDRAAACGVLLAPAATLHDLGTFVLGDHALDLKQQLLLGATADGVAQEDNLNTALGEFLEDEDLIGIFT